MSAHRRQRRFERQEAERLLGLQFQRQAEEEIRVHGRALTIEDHRSPEEIAMLDSMLQDLADMDNEA